MKLIKSHVLDAFKLYFLPALEDHNRMQATQLLPDFDITFLHAIKPLDDVCVISIRSTTFYTYPSVI